MARQVTKYSAEFTKALLPWQGRHNAEAVQRTAGLQVVEGWAVFERLQLPEGQSFVALRYSWNALPDGKWMDFSPWPSSWQQILLAESTCKVSIPPSVLQSSDWQLALHLQHLHGANLQPSGALREADEACMKLRQVEAKAEAEVARLRKSQDVTSTECPLLNFQEITATISSLTKTGRWQEVLSLLADLPETVKANVTLGVSEKFFPRRALCIFVLWVQQARMKKNRCSLMERWPRIIYSSAINACAKGKQWQQALRVLLDLMEANLQPNAICFGAAINACDRCEEWLWPLALLDDMRKLDLSASEEFCINAAMSACGKNQQWEASLILFEQLSLADVQISTVTCNTAISACEKGKQWQRAMQLLISMPSLKALPDVISFSAAISSCEKGLQWPNAVALLDGMSLEAIHPNVISLNAVIGACSFDAWQWGLHLLNNMDSWKLMPDVISFNSAIAACGTAEKWDMALRLLHSMRHSPRPNSRTYNAAIAACERGSQWEQAFQVQELMKTRKVKVDIIGCGSLISACEKCKQWDQALSLLWRHSSHPQTGIANMVLRSVIEWQMALALLGLLSLAYKI
eukprot:g16822.t1